MAITTPALPTSGLANSALNNTGDSVVASWTGGTVQAVAVTASPSVPLPSVSAPSVPATGVAATNTASVPVVVVIGANGATITAVNVNGVQLGTAAGDYVVPAGGTISIAYTVATPTWTWTAVVSALAGNGGSIAASTPFAIPPGCSVSLLYSSTPTWTWTDPINMSGAPFAAAENTSGVSGIAAQPSNLPVSSRQMGGAAGLGVMEDN